MAKLYFDLHLLSFMCVKIDLVSALKRIKHILGGRCPLDAILQVSFVIPTIGLVHDEF